jgi:PTS system ascorbate-specific IIA component
MACILLVAHAPLASALLAVAQHAFPDCSREVKALDVPASAELEGTAAAIRSMLQSMPGPDVLVLVDAFGATPCNAALLACDGVQARVVTGVNTSMLWRTLCYSHLDLNELATRAVDGGRQGIMPVASPPRQNQTNRLPSDASVSNPDQ